MRRRADLQREEHRTRRDAVRASTRARSVPSGRPARPARCRASPAPRDRSRAPWRRSRDLAIGRYDTLTAEEIIGRLTGLSQVDLAKVAAYERKHENRSTVLGRIDSLQGNEPWPGYDELTADEVRAPCSPTPTTTASARSARTSAATRTAPASSRRPSAEAATV